jgi:nitrogen fixation protein FixH
MGELTGRKVLAIALGFFGVIIAVNLTLAHQAVSTFPGIEVKNSYVASQTFEAERKAQQVLGWDLAHRYAPGDGTLTLVFRETATGFPAPVAALDVLVGRATAAVDDTRPGFVQAGGAWVAPLTLAPGKWLLRVEATAADGTVFRQRLDLFVAETGA